MKLEEINIRDPYILPTGGKYYLYGTRSESAWGNGEGFDCYISEDLSEWEGPKEIFRRPEGFFANREYWAPECVERKGWYYLLATLGGDAIPYKGIYALRSRKPGGPFAPHGSRLVPEDWDCLDGTVYEEDKVPYLVFSHSFGDPYRCSGDMAAVALNDELSAPAGEPFRLFGASEAPWNTLFPYGKEEFGLDYPIYFTDGPCLRKMPDGVLYMTWSSWSRHGYAVGLAVSENGTLRGPWKQVETPLFPKNGGHGMFFTDKTGKMYFTLHYPNDKGREHPVLYPVELKNGRARLLTD
ncbi:MAG: family 43 glycosylhydrolase [Oscillospiraceae bacterium]|nr:family 43 glycosylhydrolase [Oscillospiraceae bacterium]